VELEKKYGICETPTKFSMTRPCQHNLSMAKGCVHVVDCRRQCTAPESAAGRLDAGHHGRPGSLPLPSRTVAPSWSPSKLLSRPTCRPAHRVMGVSHLRRLRCGVPDLLLGHPPTGHGPQDIYRRFLSGWDFPARGDGGGHGSDVELMTGKGCEEDRRHPGGSDQKAVVGFVAAVVHDDAAGGVLTGPRSR